MRATHFALTAAISAVNALAAAQPIDVIYVDDDATLGGDGVSWDTAFRDLQDALHIARDQGFPIEIRVAQGTYRPDLGTLDRDASFTPSSAVTLMGAFAGLGAPNPDERDPARFISVLSGDLQGDDTPGFGNRADNAYRVVDTTHADSYSHIEGFVIRGGHANGDPWSDTDRGAGVGADRGWPTAVAIHNCLITDNFAITEGAAVFVDAGWLNIADCRIVDNLTTGQGMVTAVYSRRHLMIDRTRFSGNTSAGTVAATAIACDGYLRVHDSLFDTHASGRSVVACASEAYFLRCTFAGNSTAEWPTILGGARVWADGCIFWNVDAAGPEIRAATIQVYQSCVHGGEAALDAWQEPPEWRNSNIIDDPLFVSPTGTDADPRTWEDNDFGLALLSPCIDAGSTYVDPEHPSDVRGDPRFVASRGTCRARADIGAIEFQVEPSAAPPVRVHVSAGAAPGGDGLSWAAALPTIDAALDVPGVREIWLARGVHLPPAQDRPLYVSCDLTIVGGFAGFESSLDERDVAANPCALSGDFLGNDDDTPASLVDNAPVLLVINLAGVTLDGIIVRDTAGSEFLSGAALVTSHARLTLRNCTLERCRNVGGHQAQGGAVRAWYTDLVLDRCVLRDNRAVAASDSASGGAVFALAGTLRAIDTRFERNAVVGVTYSQCGALYADGARTEIIRCAFIGNSVMSNGVGGAVDGAFTAQVGDVTLLNSEFRGNRCSGDAWVRAGAGTITAWNGAAIIAGCVFRENTIEGAHGSVAVLNVYAQSATLINSTFAYNHALARRDEYTTSAVTVSPPSAVVANSIFWGNTSPLPGNQLSTWTDVIVTHCCIEGLDGAFPGYGNFEEDPLFASPSDLRLAPGSSCIDAGDTALLPADAADLDHDADTTEPLPLDFAQHVRVVGASVDVGAYERQPDACRADHTGDGVLNSADFFQFLSDYYSGSPDADFNASGAVSVADFFDYLNAFLAGC